MKSYMIHLERKDRCKKYKYFRFECLANDFYKALEIAEVKIINLKSQIDIIYEIIKIEKQQ